MQSLNYRLAPPLELKDSVTAPPANEEILVALEYVVFDEGIAHFVSFYPGRENRIHEFTREWRRAEENLFLAASVILADHQPIERKFEMLRKAGRGPYWEKFGAIAGKFRAISIYRKGGVAALRLRIAERKIPSCPDEGLTHNELRPLPSYVLQLKCPIRNQ